MESAEKNFVPKKSKLNAQNLKIQEEYKKFLRYTRQLKLNSDTINSKMVSIRKYDELFKYADYKEFNTEKAITFHNYLINSDLDLSTVFKHLYNMKEFFHWYFAKHKVSKKHLEEALSALEPSEEEKRLSRRLNYVEYPTMEEYEKIINFEEKNLTDKRDKAIIAFLFISLARIGAVSTATIEAIDIKKMIFKQDPLESIKTKRSKHIITKLLKFDEKYYQIFKDWYNFLVANNFSGKDPLFPEIKNDLLTKKFFGKEIDYNRMLEKRCIAAKTPEYTPHAFRHFGIYQCFGKITNGFQLKALSQNVGHEDVRTILEQYGNMPVNKYTQVLEKMFEVDDIENEHTSKLSTSILLKIVQQRLGKDLSF